LSNLPCAAPCAYRHARRVSANDSPRRNALERRKRTPDQAGVQWLFPVADCDDRKRLAGRLRNAINKLDVPVTISAGVDGVWMRRREAGKKARKGKPRRNPSGDGRPKLTDDEVREVRRRRAGDDALAAIGRAAGVSSCTVRRIF